MLIVLLPTSKQHSNTNRQTVWHIHVITNIQTKCNQHTNNMVCGYSGHIQNSSRAYSSSLCNHHNNIKQTAMVMTEGYSYNHDINDKTNTPMDSGSGLSCQVHEQQHSLKPIMQSKIQCTQNSKSSIQTASSNNTQYRCGVHFL